MTSGFTAFLPFVGQALAIGLGWYVVHRLSSKRDRDKARRDMLADSSDGLAGDAKKLLLAARSYHLGDRSVPNEIEIKMDLQDMSLRASALSILSSDEASLGACRASIAALRRSITGKHFEDEHTRPLSDGDALLQSIAADTLRVQQAFLKLKHLQFPAQ